MQKNKFQNIASFVGRGICRVFSFAKFEKITGKTDPLAAIKRINNLKRAAVLIGILILVLGSISLTLRCCECVEPPFGTVEIPGNVIDPPLPEIIPKADLEFSNKNDGENIPFSVEGMDKGVKTSIYYRLIATYNSEFVLKYEMSIRDNEEYQKLAEILKIKAELVGEKGESVLYNGLLVDMPELEILLKADVETTTEYLFRITAYLDASFEDQYYGQKLIADMHWWIEGQDNIGIANCEFNSVSKTMPPDPPNPPVIDTDLIFVHVNEGDNTGFDMKNIKNGDSQTRYFAFEVTHGEDVIVVVKNIVVLDSKICEVLTVTVELVGDDGNITLYEGLLKDLIAEHTLHKNDNNKTTLYYKISVTADGLTEEYCETKLVSDLSWSLEGTSEELRVPSNSFVAYDKPYTPPDIPNPPNPPSPPNPPQPPVTATSIELTAKDGYANIPFDVKNMLPGDIAEQYYCVSVTHDSKKNVCFSITVDASQKLSKVLRVKVEQLVPNAQDKILYNGLMMDFKSVSVSVTANSKTVTPVYYRITVYTNGAEVGNEYAGESLTADFSWQLQ